MISNLDLLVIGILTALTAILSGITGGGGGFIMTPLLIFLGLSPAQAVATGKLSGLSVTIGSLHGLRSVKATSKKRVLAIMVLALAVGLAAPYFINNLDSELYKNILGVMILLMIPVMIFKKVGIHAVTPTPLQRSLGYIFLVVSLMLQAVFSGGLGVLVSIVLMAFIGMPALEANITKRYSQVILNTVIVIGVLFSGLIVWKVALVGIVAAFIGGMIGGRIAVKKGNGFVMTIMIGIMALSALWLIFG